MQGGGGGGGGEGCIEHSAQTDRCLQAVSQDSARYSSAFRQNLSPLVSLQQRATQVQQPSHHSLFSTAVGKPSPAAPTASAQAEPLPTASLLPVNSTTSLARSNSRGISSHNVASTSQAGLCTGNGEGQSRDDHPPDSTASAGSSGAVIGTGMSHGNTSSDHPDATTNPSSDTTAVVAPAAHSAALGAHQAGEGEAEEVGVPRSSWQPETQTQAGQLEQEQLVRAWQQLVRDPFALLVHLLAFIQPPQDSPDGDGGESVSAASAAAAAGDRVQVFQASG